MTEAIASGLPMLYNASFSDEEKAMAADVFMNGGETGGAVPGGDGGGSPSTLSLVDRVKL